MTTGVRTPIAIHLSGWSPDRGDLEFVIVDGVDHGRLVQHGSDVLYVPSRSFCGHDAFRFVVREHGETSRPATVSIDVRAHWSTSAS